MNSSTTQNKTVLNVSELTFCHHPVDLANSNAWAIRKLSLMVDAGEIVCILGASGCGKSTLLNLIAGLLKPISGKIDLSAKSPDSKKESTKGSQKIGYIFQQDALFPWRTVEANLLLARDVTKDLSRNAARERIHQYLATFHLDENILKQYPSQLSGGMRQRVSIIQSLMFDPELLLLDEPFSALDFYTKLSLENEFYQLVKEKKKAAVVITHDIEEAIAMANRVLIMNKNGTFIREFTINMGSGDRTPEIARGTPEFANYYREIWSELKTVISE